MAKLFTKINTKQNKKQENTVNLLICRNSFTYCFRKNLKVEKRQLLLSTNHT